MPSFWCQGVNYVSRFKIQDSGIHLPNISLCLGDSTLQRFQDSSFKIQVSSRQLPDISLFLEGSTERSNGSPGRTLGKILYGFRVLAHVLGIDALRAFQDSGVNWQCV